MAPPKIPKRSIWVVATVIAVAGLFAVVVPYVASARLVSERIEDEMSRWSGYRVEIDGPAKIEIWPRLRATFDNVTFSDRSEQGMVEVARADHIQLELSAMDALSGDAVFSSAVVVRPRIRLPKDRTLAGLSLLAGKGRLRRAIDDARMVIKSEASSKAPMPSDTFGVVRIEDGQILVGDSSDPTIQAINGSLDWPSLSSAASLSISGTWRGQATRVTLQSASPLTLLAGGNAPVKVGLEGDLGAANFDGNANLTTPVFMDGRASVRVADVGRLSALADLSAEIPKSLRSAAISGSITGDLRRLKLDAATVDLNKDHATGAIDINLGAPTPVISGSLAFATMRIDDVISLFLDSRPLVTNPDRRLMPIDLDLRLSAAHALVDSIDLADAAAALQVKSEVATLDLIDASAFGGSIKGSMRLEVKPASIDAAMNLRADGIDGGALGAGLGMDRLVPIGRGSIAIDLKGDGEDARAALLSGTGQASAKFGAGALSKFDLNAFMDLWAKGSFFSLDQSAASNFAIDGMELAATIESGVARVDKAEAWNGERRIWVTGVASYADKALALTGGVAATSAANAKSADRNDATFFVGGSWAAPYISPILQNQPIE